MFSDDLAEVPVETLQWNDVIDLEGDIYADPHHTNAVFHWEYSQVERVVDKEPGVIELVCNSYDGYFPHGHLIKKMKNHSHRLHI